MPTVPASHDYVAAFDLAQRASTPEEYRRAIDALELFADDVKDANIYTMLGRMYREIRSNERATAAFRAASLLDPDHAGLLSNTTCFLRDFDREAEAIAMLKCALRRDPHLVEAWHNLGAMLRNTGDLELALACFREAGGESPSALTELGIGEILLPLGYPVDAIAHSDRAAKHSEPGSMLHIEAVMARGLARVATGDLGTGWDDLEARLQRFAFTALEPKGIPQWAGPGSSARHVLVWREQGIGDEMRFLSCLADLTNDVEKVTVRCSERLVPIITRTFAVDVVTGTLDVPETADAHLAMGSLMRHYRRTVDDFPTNSATLTPDPVQVNHWRDRLAAIDGRRKVGISWRSRIMTNRRNQHYPDFASLAQLSQCENVTWIDLQYDHSADELAELRSEWGMDIHHFEDLDLMNNIDGVCALTAALDAAVVVGNSVSEIAGSVGTRTFEMNIDHIPLMFGRTDSLWHPSVSMCTRAWSEPWTVAVDKTAAALATFLNNAPTQKEFS